MHQKQHNSGVIHTGVYYRPGSHKARFCVEGAKRLIRFCAERNIPLATRGKVIVATDERQLPWLDELLRRSTPRTPPPAPVETASSPFTSGQKALSHSPETKTPAHQGRAHSRYHPSSGRLGRRLLQKQELERSLDLLPRITVGIRHIYRDALRHPFRLRLSGDLRPACAPPGSHPPRLAPEVEPAYSSPSWPICGHPGSLAAISSRRQRRFGSTPATVRPEDSQ